MWYLWRYWVRCGIDERSSAGMRLLTILTSDDGLPRTLCGGMRTWSLDVPWM